MTLDIPSYRLSNQRLSQNKLKSAAEVVSLLGAVQAQDYSGAKWAIGLRTKGVVDADVESVFTDGSILRTHLLRPTWHFVTPEDIRWILALTAPRVRALMAYMDRQVKLDSSIFKKSNAALIKALQGGKQLTRAELGSVLQESRIPAEGLRLGQLLMRAELDGIVCSGPRRGKQFTYALLEERVPPARSWTRDESLAELVKRYFLTRGPATFKDFCVWSGLTMTDARNGMDMVKSQFVNETIAGQSYWFAEIKPPARKKSPAAWLLPNYDEYFIGFKDRSAIGKLTEPAGIRKDDPALLAHILILNGQVAGGWRRTINKDSVDVEVRLLTKLKRDEEQAVEEAAENFGEFLGLPVSLTLKESVDEQRTTRSF